MLKKHYRTKQREINKRKNFTLFIAVLVGVIAIAGAYLGAIFPNQVFAYETTTINVPRAILSVSSDAEPTVEDVKAEIRTQAELFGVDVQFALDLADCESTFNYKAKNPNSTARGVYQYLIRTWEATESAKQGLERNDYKANIREAMLDIANGEHYQKWSECLQ